MERKLALAVYAAIGITMLTAVGLRAAREEPGAAQPNLSGRWQLNQRLSENAQAKIDRAQSSGGHGPGRHGGAFGRLFGGGDMEEARKLIVNAPSSFTLVQDGDRIVLTDSAGGVRTLTVNGGKEKVNGRDVQARWNGQRLVAETWVGKTKVSETFERSGSAPQLIVTSKADMRGHEVSVRRVYDAEGAR